MDDNTRKEQFSKAYVRAVAVMGDADVLQPEVDRDSIDLILKRVGGKGEQVDLQLKCTADPIPASGDLSFVLKLKNYNDLRCECVVPRFLVVVHVPSVTDDWLESSEESLIMHRCGWLLDLRGYAATGNTSNVTVTLPRADRFTPELLKSLFDAQRNNFQPISSQ